MLLYIFQKYLVSSECSNMCYQEKKMSEHSTLVLYKLH